MTPQINLALKRSVLTDVARERLESCVLATVSDKVGRLAERLAALTTCIRFLTYRTSNNTV